MASVGRLVAVLVGVLAAVGPSVALTSHETIDAAYDQGIARTSDGWAVSGRNVLARLDENLGPVARHDGAIPAVWAQRGFDHIGDVDIAGSTLYVPFEQPDYERGRQAMARYDARSLTFRDATVVNQHENSFVAVDSATGIAYSMDRFGGKALLRYDVRASWRRLAPLRMNRTLERVQGAAVARNAVWLVTDDDHNGLYRVDIDTGSVADLGSASPLAGEAEGVDAAALSSGELHATVVDADRRAITLDHFRTSGEPGADAGAARSSAQRTDTSWPPALVYFAIFIAAVALAAAGTIFRRARTTLRPKG
jgi:hypothetical protein